MKRTRESSTVYEQAAEEHRPQAAAPRRNQATPLAIAMGVLLFAGVAQAQTVTRQSVSGAGVEANASSVGNAVSGDGRHVAFASDAQNLVPGTSPFTDVFVHDNTTGATVCISRAASGGAANGGSGVSAITPDGRFVVFASGASNLVAGDTNGLPDVFRHDRDTDGDGIFDEVGATATIRVSLGAFGDEPNASCSVGPRSISNDGNIVVFETSANNILLVGQDTNLGSDVFVRIVAAPGPTTQRVSVTSGGLQLGSSGGGFISGDGNRVGFYSVPSAVVPNNQPPGQHVFVRDRALSTTTQVDVTTTGGSNPGPYFANGFSLSADGRYAAFTSDTPDLVTGDTNNASDVFVRDLLTSATSRVSVATGGAQATGDPMSLQSYGGALSADGSIVAFTSNATNLVPNDNNGVHDVFARDLVAGTTVRASRATDGTEPDGLSQGADISADGLFVAFVSDATNLVVGDANGWTDVFLRGQPFAGPGGTDPGPPIAADFPVTFSVNGPVDPHTEGIGYARGGAPAAGFPGNPVAFGIRGPAVPIATGLATAFPGDVFDYGPPPSEAVMFQSPPGAPADPLGPATPPDGTNNQILEAISMGLMAGGVVPPGAWTTVPPARDNIDAFSFGEDYFPFGLTIGLASMPYPAPPMSGGEIDAVATPWDLRTSLYSEPIVVDDAMGVSFRFSVDPWALGVPGSDVVVESGGGDVGAGLGPWASPGDAAGDVFGTPILTRVGGATVGGGDNALVDDNPALALAPAPPPMAPFEDDLDGLECIGPNTWALPAGFRPGNLHARVVETGPADFPIPGFSIHEPSNMAPDFFSVTRSSTGGPFSAVRTQFVLDGGAAADVFVAVKDPAEPPGDGTNLLFIGQAELGLLPTDDLDALLLWVCPEYRLVVNEAIAEILGLRPPLPMGGYMPWAPAGASIWSGGGMTTSIVQYLQMTARPIPADCIRVGFSVTTDAIGMEYTAVDWEAGPVAPAAGFSTAAGDVFYAEVDGDPVNANYLWYEEVDVGLDPGMWVNGVSADLAALADNLDALDSTLPADEVPPMAPLGLMGVYQSETISSRPAVPGDFRAAATVRGTRLNWNANPEADLWQYRLYRGSSSGFVPGPSNLIASPVHTTYFDVGPAGRYYKLSAMDAKGHESAFSTLTPQATVGVGGKPSLAFGVVGVRPNPAAGTSLEVEFVLQGTATARLELFDVVGRRVAEREVGSLGAGRHQVALGDGSPLARGLYLVRLTEGREVAVKRIVVTR